MPSTRPVHSYLAPRRRPIAWATLFSVCGLAALTNACGDDGPSEVPAMTTPSGGDTAAPSPGGGGGVAMGGAAGGTAPGGGAAPGAPPSGGSGGSSTGGTDSSGGGSDAVAGSGGMGAGGAAADGGAANGGGAGAGGAGEGGAGGEGPSLPKKVLLFHPSGVPNIPSQLDLLSAELTRLGFDSERSTDAAVFTTEKLAEFGAVAMINNCFEPFGKGNDGLAETEVLTAFVEGGGGLFGIHCATVTFKDVNPPHPYNVLFGGRGHGGFFTGQSDCRKIGSHPSIDQLPETFSYTGNLDNADYIAPDSTVLVQCKWSGGEMKDAAISWVREQGSGRVFFANFAKTDEDLRPGDVSQKHIFPGLAWVLRQ